LPCKTDKGGSIIVAVGVMVGRVDTTGSGVSGGRDVEDLAGSGDDVPVIDDGGVVAGVVVDVNSLSFSGSGRQPTSNKKLANQTTITNLDFSSIKIISP
jgi:hypothetical protein